MNNKLGAHYFKTSEPSVIESDLEQLYFFKTYIGDHEISVEKGDSVFYFDNELKHAKVLKGPIEIQSKHVATVVRGYMHPNASSSLNGVTTLPYINGCSTKQIFPPLRLGDPTLQYLLMPPNSKEQEHHIHSTARIVLIVEGSGKSIVGLGSHASETELKPGTVVVLEPMCPHHFESGAENRLVAIPLHIFSSIGELEKNHPMFNGTIII